MPEIIIRSATPSDMETLLYFEQAIVTAERPFNSTLKAGEVHYYDLKKLLEDSKTEILVAELEGKVVSSGYASINEASTYVLHDHYAHLGFMYVLPEHRGKGIIRMLIEELKVWAMQQGVTEFRLEVYHDNLPAVKAYKKAGFEMLLTEMRLSID